MNATPVRWLAAIVALGVILFVWATLGQIPMLAVGFSMAAMFWIWDRQTATAAKGTKTCPRCAELVRAAAQVCRFCGYSFKPPTR